MKRYGKRVSKPYPTLYHISFNDKLEGLWTPRPPDGDYDPVKDTVSLHGEPLTPRISAAPILTGCFQGIYANVKHLFDKYPELTFNIYVVDFRGHERVVFPEQLSAHKLVHDAHITQEHAILDPVKMRHVGKCVIGKPQGRLDYWAFDGPQRGKSYGWLPVGFVVKPECIATPSYREREDSMFQHNQQFIPVNTLLERASHVPTALIPIKDLFGQVAPKDLDRRRLSAADVRYPLIAIKDAQYGLVVADGTHRLHKLTAMGYTHANVKIVQVDAADVDQPVGQETNALNWMRW